MERIGTLQARVAIILVFFALIYFPLHEALSRVVAQVSERGRRQEWIQVINQEAQRRFRIKDRSDIEKIDVENSPQGLRTLVRVSTNRLFEPEDRQEFEAVVSKRLNLPVRLVLIQSPGFFGEEKGADWTRVLGTQTAPPKEVSVQERYVLLFDRIQTVVLELWPLPKKSLLDLKIHLEEKKEGMITPSLTLSYLGNNDLGEDAKNVFQAGLKQVLGIDPEIRWNWIPSQYGPFNLKAGRTILSQEGREKIIKVSQTLQEFPELEAEIQFTSPPLPRRKRRQTPLPDYSLKIAAELEEQGLTSSQFVLTELEQETPQLLLSLKPRSNSQNSEENNLKAPIPTPTTPPIQAAETLPESQPEGGPDK